MHKANAEAGRFGYVASDFQYALPLLSRKSLGMTLVKVLVTPLSF